MLGEIISILVVFGIVVASVALLVFIGIIAGKFAFIITDHIADWLDDMCDIFGNWLHEKANRSFQKRATEEKKKNKQIDNDQK